MMKGDNILLTRIDNRLVHGQVGVTWTKTIGANLIVVCDEEAANDQLQQQLMTFTAKSSGVGIRFFTVDFTAQVIDNASPDQKIFLVVKTPATVRALIEKGVHLKDINVGNMHFSNGKRALTKKVYVDDQDMADLKFAAEQGSNVYCQDVPGDSIEKIQ